MTRNITILYGHPDASKERLCYTLARAFQDSAQLTGHAVRRINLSDFHLQSVRSSNEFQAGKTPDFVQDTQQAIEWADHIYLFSRFGWALCPESLKCFWNMSFARALLWIIPKRDFLVNY